MEFQKYLIDIGIYNPLILPPLHSLCPFIPLLPSFSGWFFMINYNHTFLCTVNSFLFLLLWPRKQLHSWFNPTFNILHSFLLHSWPIFYVLSNQISFCQPCKHYLAQLSISCLLTWLQKSHTPSFLPFGHSFSVSSQLLPHLLILIFLESLKTWCLDIFSFKSILTHLLISFALAVINTT